jgi:hypothetical protein
MYVSGTILAFQKVEQLYDEQMTIPQLRQCLGRRSMDVKVALHSLQFGVDAKGISWGGELA